MAGFEGMARSKRFPEALMTFVYCKLSPLVYGRGPANCALCRWLRAPGLGAIFRITWRYLHDGRGHQ